MNWEKKGLVFTSDGKYEWNKSHAQVPVADVASDDVLRVYYATRNSNNISQTSYIEVDAKEPAKVLYVHNNPILPLGKLGAFDEHGIMPSCVINAGSNKYLYYIGWSQRKSVPYQNSIGLAISTDNGKTFQKYSDGPVLGINHIDPFFTGTICVIKEDFFKAYYLSCTEWKLVNNKPEPLYVLKYATSDDGINWLRSNKISISFKNENEGGLVSATVLKQGHNYYMLFGCRDYFDFRNNVSHSYKIGYADSNDSINWKRDDSKSGIVLSAEGWDSEMISYPYILQSKANTYLFYNGNHFGKSGFGYAILNSL